jgi:hypothetical protein
MLGDNTFGQLGDNIAVPAAYADRCH